LLGSHACPCLSRPVRRPCSSFANSSFRPQAKRLRPVCEHRPGASEPNRDPRLPPDTPPPKGKPNWNPFKDTKKEDAARAALQDMFKGKDDLLAVYDDRGGGGGGGRGKGTGGSGSSDDGFHFDPKGWARSLWNAIKGVAKTLGAIALFGVLLAAVSLWGPLWNHHQIDTLGAAARRSWC
jgi:hypothetical protein